MIERQNPYLCSATITCKVIVPEEEMRDDIYVKYAFAVGKLYIEALNRGWDDIAADLLDDLRRHGFYMRKDEELCNWVIHKER